MKNTQQIYFPKEASTAFAILVYLIVIFYLTFIIIIYLFIFILSYYNPNAQDGGTGKRKNER